MIVVEMAYKNNLSFQTLWIEIQFSKKTIACGTDKTKPLLSPTVKKEQFIADLPVRVEESWRFVSGGSTLSFETNSFQEELDVISTTTTTENCQILLKYNSFFSVCCQ